MHIIHAHPGIYSSTLVILLFELQSCLCPFTIIILNFCPRFHLLEEFDDDKRSCRRRLAGHNRRRRKPRPYTAVNGIPSEDNRTSGYLLTSLLRILTNLHCTFFLINFFYEIYFIQKQDLEWALIDSST